MEEILFELPETLRSKREKLTSLEANVLMTCKSNAVRDLTIGAAAGGGITWLATQRLSRFFRITLSAGKRYIHLSLSISLSLPPVDAEVEDVSGTAIFYGTWRFGRSLGSCAQHILSLDGSTMQKELATIMLKRHQGDPAVLQLISKHFYPEIVFADSSPDHPKLRWRYRNSYVDNIAYSQTTQNSDETGSERINKENNNDPKQVYRNPAVDVFTNPFDCIFGLPASSEEIHHLNTSGTSFPKRNGHSHRRYRRRHRIHHHEVSTNHQVA